MSLERAAVADVAIVGYGPVGQALSALLAGQGHRVCVIERYAQLYPLPRAFRFDGEVMRILQRLDVVDADGHAHVDARPARRCGP